MQPRPSVPGRRSSGGTGSSRKLGRQADGNALDGPHHRKRPNHALPIGWRRWRQPHGRILRLAAVGGHFVRNGTRRIRCTMGSILAGAPLPMIREPKWKARAVAIEFWIASIVVGGSFVAGIVSGVRYLLE